MATSPKSQVLFLDPTGAVRDRGKGLAPRPATLDGLVMGIVDDGLPNCDSLLNGVVEELLRRFKLKGTVRAVKPSFSSPLPAKKFEEMLRGVNFAIVGVGV